MEQISELAKLDKLPEVEHLVPSTVQQPQDRQPRGTKLYLAYGSNLAASTFLKRRNIKPLRAFNVLAPDLQLVFDLPGIPYNEPCFANSRVRRRRNLNTSPLYQQLSAELNPHERDLLLPVNPSTASLGWDKGLVGVAYEVTDSDFAKIIATEGGGWAYLDVEVDCWLLAPGSDIIPDDSDLKGSPVRVHTLLAKTAEKAYPRKEGWAEPSPRYLGLLTTGSEEHQLPREYRDWLATLRGYRITTVGQRAGQLTIMASWLPFGIFLITLQSAFAGKDGRTPEWLARITDSFFKMMWWTYDTAYYRLFGDGERTIGDRL